MQSPEAYAASLEEAVMSCTRPGKADSVGHPIKKWNCSTYMSEVMISDKEVDRRYDDRYDSRNPKPERPFSSSHGALWIVYERMLMVFISNRATEFASRRSARTASVGRERLHRHSDVDASHRT